jgi:hypothetical protein
VRNKPLEAIEPRDQDHEIEEPRGRSPLKSSTINEQSPEIISLLSYRDSVASTPVVNGLDCKLDLPIIPVFMSDDNEDSSAERTVPKIREPRAARRQEKTCNLCCSTASMMAKTKNRRLWDCQDHRSRPPRSCLIQNRLDSLQTRAHMLCQPSAVLHDESDKNPPGWHQCCPPLLTLLLQ